MMTIRRLSAAAIVGALLLTAYSASDARSARTAAAAGNWNASVVPAGALRFAVSSTGNAARYRVREQLMGKDLPNDAIGETGEITGFITVDSTTGAIIPGQSKFVVNTGAFKSDSDRRDGYVRGRLLEAAKFPTVELSPMSVRGLAARATTAAGPISFELVGDLTVKGVTHPTTWKVTARQAGGKVTGSATTRFTFADFGITPPKVPILLSVADTIALEYDFTLARDLTAKP